MTDVLLIRSLHVLKMTFVGNPQVGVLELVKGVFNSLIDRFLPADGDRSKPLACPSGAAKEEVERVLFDGNHPHPNFNVMGEDIGHVWD